MGLRPLRGLYALTMGVGALWGATEVVAPALSLKERVACVVLLAAGASYLADAAIEARPK